MTKLPMCTACGSSSCTAFGGACAAIIECKDRQIAAARIRETCPVCSGDGWLTRGERKQSESEAVEAWKAANGYDDLLKAYGKAVAASARRRELLSRVYMWRGSGLPSGLWRDLETELNGTIAEAGKAQAEGWVPVGERLPEHYEAVLVVDGDGAKPEPYVAFREEDERWHVYSSSFPIVGPTHWKPFGALPSPSEEGK